MAYEPRPFMPYEPFLLGVGVVFHLLIIACGGAWWGAAVGGKRKGLSHEWRR